MPPSEEDRDSGPSSDTGDGSDRSENVDEFVFDRGERDIEEEDGSRGADPGDPDDPDMSGRPDPDVPWDRASGERSGVEEADTGVVEWMLNTDDAGMAFFREFVGSVLLVLFIGLLLFAISGVWPPMVAVKSGSMEPHMYRGDLVFVMDEDRLPPEAAIEGSGVATHRSSVETGYRRFGDHGDVIVYRKNGRADATPIIHRSRFWVNEGENWYGKANRSFVNGDSCDAIPNCPAPHAGFITKGDGNGQYDQITGISEPVKLEWVKGTAEVRIPWLGHVRLELSELQVGVGVPVLESEPVEG